MSTITTLPALRHRSYPDSLHGPAYTDTGQVPDWHLDTSQAMGDHVIVVFCSTTCRSAYDGPPAELHDIEVERVHPAARCWCCGEFLRPEQLGQCMHCRRLGYYDDQERYHHLERPEVGCFLIGPESGADRPAGIPDRPQSATMEGLRAVLLQAAITMGVRS